MQYCIYIFFILFAFSCKSDYSANYNQPPALRVVNYDSSLQKINDTWFYQHKLFSGYVIEIEKNNRVVYELPVVKGKENGLARGWYNTGEKLMERNFINGKKEGLFQQWWPNGKLRYAFYYTNDVFDGKQIIYYPNGDIREEDNYLSGNKEGVQRVWNEDRTLASNYTIRNRKLYGVVKVRSCIPVLH